MRTALPVDYPIYLRQRPPRQPLGPPGPSPVTGILRHKPCHGDMVTGRRHSPACHAGWQRSAARLTAAWSPSEEAAHCGGGTPPGSSCGVHRGSPRFSRHQLPNMHRLPTTVAGATAPHCKEGRRSGSRHGCQYCGNLTFGVEEEEHAAGSRLGDVPRAGGGVDEGAFRVVPDAVVERS